MAFKSMDEGEYLKMNPAARQARIAELQALQDQPQNAVGGGSRLWRGAKTLLLIGVGAVIGAKVGGAITKYMTKEGKEVGKVGEWLLNHKKLVGAGVVATAGGAYMKNNSNHEANDKLKLELAKAQAIQTEYEKSLYFQNTINTQDLAKRDALTASGKGKQGGFSGNYVQQRGGGQEQGV